MKPEQYDTLLRQVREARKGLDRSLKTTEMWREELDNLLEQLDQEESRIAHEALHPTPIASRKLVIHE